jgi:hypothetical protein
MKKLNSLDAKEIGDGLGVNKTNARQHALFKTHRIFKL